MSLLKNLFYTIYCSFIFIILVIFFYLLSFAVYSFSPKNKKTLNHNKTISLWARIFLWLSGLYPKIQGPSGFTKSGIYIMNHQSMFDTFIALAFLPPNTTIGAKKELFQIPFLGGILKRAGYIPINRKDKNSTRKVLSSLETALINKQSIMLYPEGTRSKQGNLKTFKKGFLLLAKRTKSNIYSLVCDPPYLINNGFLLSPTKITLSYLTPISYSSLQNKTITEKDIFNSFEVEIKALRNE